MKYISKRIQWIAVGMGLAMGIPVMLTAATSVIDELNVFSPNTVISSSKVNENFVMLDDRLATYEDAITVGGNNSVGIGTTAPSRTLDVAANVVHSSAAGITSQLTLRGTTDSNNKLNVGYDTTYHFGFIEAVNESTAWQSLALQPSGGNVGVGTTSPEAKLHVSGSTSLSLPGGSFSGIGSYDPQESNRTSLKFGSVTAAPISTSVIPTGAMWKVILRGVWANDYEGAGLAQPAPYIEVTSELPSVYIGSILLTISRDASTGRLVGLTSSAVPSTQIGFSGAIDVIVNGLTNNGGSSSIVVPGKVGIGTTQPSEALSVHGRQKFFAGRSPMIVTSRNDNSVFVGTWDMFTIKEGSAMVNVHLEHNGGSALYQLSVVYSANGKSLMVVSSNVPYAAAAATFALNPNTGVVTATNNYGAYCNFIAQVMATSFTTSI